MFNISMSNIKAAPQVKVIVGHTPDDLEEKINAFYAETYNDYAIINVDYEIPEKSFDTLQRVYAFITYARITEATEGSGNENEPAALDTDGAEASDDDI